MPNTRDLKKIIRGHSGSLRNPVEQDEVLSAVASQSPTHAFLANSIQAVYRRQVRWLRLVLCEYCGRAPESIKVLDWGCGKGHISHLLLAEGFDVTSCDLASEVRDSAFGQRTPLIKHAGISVVPLQSPTELPFANNSFDCVVSFGVLEHVDSDQGSLCELTRILRPGGLVFITFLPYFLSWTQVIWKLRGVNYLDGGFHEKLYTFRRMRELADSSGLEIVFKQLAQLFPKNSVPLGADRILEPMDRVLCNHTPLRYFATNMEMFLKKGPLQLKKS